MVEMLLQREDVDVNEPRDDGMTPLAVAAHRGHVDIVKRLLRHPKVSYQERGCVMRPQNVRTMCYPWDALSRDGERSLIFQIKIKIT